MDSPGCPRPAPSPTCIVRTRVVVHVVGIVRVVALIRGVVPGGLPLPPRRRLAHRSPAADRAADRSAPRPTRAAAGGSRGERSPRGGPLRGERSPARGGPRGSRLVPAASQWGVAFLPARAPVAAEVSARKPPLPHQLQLVEDGVRGVRAVRRERPVAVPTGPVADAGCSNRPEAERSSVQVRVILPVDGAIRGRPRRLPEVDPAPRRRRRRQSWPTDGPRATRPALRKNRRARV